MNLYEKSLDELVYELQQREEIEMVRLNACEKIEIKGKTICGAATIIIHYTNNKQDW
ncbi:BC1881 family protein [Bacillus thuringiensis]|uniref:BC1881 family protein n=1 Tax=Bacillus thuringiensis TaxID=1428 RepID=UPI000E527E1C|nr:BC1881 family protein [Bacillus thuringiensis]MDZ3956911.1 BC1881 family protein [Bacillus thuringiensis]